MKPGDIIETAIWLDGTETPAQRRQFEEDVRAALLAGQEEHDVVVGPLTLTEKRPGEERVPPVPDHIAGPDVRLLVAEARVMCALSDLHDDGSRLVDELEPDDLARLVFITRRAYAQLFPHRPLLTDAQCHTIINDIGPEAALAALSANDTDLNTVWH